jgi:putative protein-disulfide isomerase
MLPTDSRIFYLYDALCGWCYGFSPVMVKLHANYGDRIGFEVVSGGMIRGAAVRPASTMADYIMGAYPRVEQLTGIKFGEAYLELLRKGTSMLNSVPPALAMSLFKQKTARFAVEFAADIQRAIHFEGAEPDDWKGYAVMASNYGWDMQEFLDGLENPMTMEWAQEEFELCEGWGVQGFPAVVLLHNQQLMMIAQGYTPYEVLEERLKMAIKD